MREDEDLDESDSDFAEHEWEEANALEQEQQRRIEEEHYQRYIQDPSFVDDPRR